MHKPKQHKHLPPDKPPADKRAVAYIRTSSATNADSDSVPRQRAAITAHAKRARLKLEAEFPDLEVGTDAIDKRPGFLAALTHAKKHGISVIVVETASRFARDLIVQELGLILLRREGIQLVAADSPDAFAPTDDPMAVAVRQMLGVMAQLDRAMTVAKLRSARDRASQEAGKRVEGRKPYAETHPELVRKARGLARKPRGPGKPRSLREISAELAKVGFLTSKGTPLPAEQIARLLRR